MSLIDVLQNNQTLVDEGFYEYRHDGTHVLLTQEGRNLADNAGWQRVLPVVMASLAIARAEPTGRYSVDEDKAHPLGRAHSVHRLTEGAEAVFRAPIAVKGRFVPLSPGKTFDTWHADLKDQFTRMHKLATRQQQKHPEGIGGCVFMCRPLGYIACDEKFGVQKWLFMQRVENGRTVAIVDARNEFGETRPGFVAEDYPELEAQVGSSASRNGRIPFEDLAYSLSRALGGQDSGRDLGDLHGKNIIVNESPNNERAFVVIDTHPQ